MERARRCTTCPRLISVADYLKRFSEERLTYAVDKQPSDQQVQRDILVADIALMLSRAIRAGMK